jgi:PncC family amidohydrolase
MEEYNLTLTARKTAEALFQKLSAVSRTLVLAESCTAGLVSSLLAGIPGASMVLWGSFVCYTREAKINMLGLDGDQLLINGLVSRETACLMALGALRKSGADIAAAVTGLAGPGGDDSNAAGTVWIALALQDSSTNVKGFHFTGTRNEVRLKAAIAVLELVQGQELISC